MAEQITFYGFADIAGTSILQQVSPPTNKIVGTMKNNLDTDKGPLDLLRIYFPSTGISSIGSGVLSITGAPRGSAGTIALYLYRENGSNLNCYLDTQFRQKNKGISRFGIRLMRSTTNLGYSWRLLGSFGNSEESADVLKGYSINPNTLKEEYLEFEMNWATNELTIYSNDLKIRSFFFTGAPKLILGSHIKSVYERKDGIAATELTTSWGFEANTSKSISISDIYVMYWDGEGEDPGRLGPINCINFSVDFEAGTHYKYTGMDKTEFISRPIEVSTERYTAVTGVQTLSSNEPFVTFPKDGVKSPIPEGFEAIGVTAAVSGSNLNATMNTESKVEMYLNEKWVDSVVFPNAKIINGRMEGDLPVGKPISVRITSDDLNKVNWKTTIRRLGG